MSTDQERQQPESSESQESEIFYFRQRLRDIRMYLLDESCKRGRKDAVLEEAYQMTQRHLGWRPNEDTRNAGESDS